MPFSDQTQFPRGHKILENLDSTPVTMFAANTSFKIRHIIVCGSGGDSDNDREITFRGVGGGTVITVVSMAANQCAVLPGWQTDAEGVEVLTNSGTNEIHVTAFTVEPIIP